MFFFLSKFVLSVFPLKEPFEVFFKTCEYQVSTRPHVTQEIPKSGVGIYTEGVRGRGLYSCIIENCKTDFQGTGVCTNSTSLLPA